MNGRPSRFSPPRFRYAWKLLQSFRAEMKGQFKRAIQLLDEAGEIMPLRASDRVDRAMLLLRAQHIDGKRALATPKTVFRAGILAAGVLVLSGCSDLCANTLISRADAPDGQHSAVMFQRDCGATTAFSTQVSVMERGGEPAGSGNTFRADDGHGAAAVGEWGGPWTEVTWIARDHLLIRYAAKSRIFKQVQEVSGMKISYQQVTR